MMVDVEVLVGLSVWALHHRPAVKTVSTFLCASAPQNTHIHVIWKNMSTFQTEMVKLNTHICS